MAVKKYLTEVVLLTKSYNLQDFADWLHWHLDIIGFESAHIFDNESLVDIKSVCEKYGPRVTYERVVGWANQYSLYTRYVNTQSPAWWVLPIDDDEFLFVGSRFNHNVNDLMLSLMNKWGKMVKLSIGWRNMFPMEFTETRTTSLIQNATGWSDIACSKLYPIWRQDNRWVKTFVKTVIPWSWGLPFNGGHNPTYKDRRVASKLIDGRDLLTDFVVRPFAHNDDLFIAHYQYKSNSEWLMKCAKRVSAANKAFNKNKPSVYKDLYKYRTTFNCFEKLVSLWNG